MRRADSNELREDANPALVLNLSEARRQELFPVPFEPMDPFSEAEPSEGALVQLNDGLHVVVIHGTITHRVTLSLPASADVRRAIRTVFAEVPIHESEIVWAAESAAKTAAR